MNDAAVIKFQGPRRRPTATARAPSRLVADLWSN